MKFVFSLSSDISDVYLEQLLLSVYSLRKYNCNAVVELVVDQQTNSTLNGKRGEIVNYLDEIKVVEVPDKYDKVETSRWLKTNIRRYIKGDYLFIDNDTVICGNLDDIKKCEGDIHAVYDGHNRSSASSHFLLEISSRDGWKVYDNLEYFNSGIFYVKDNEKTRVFYDRWHENWKLGLEKHQYYKDQSSLALTNEQFSYLIKPLGGEWNCQVLSNGLPFLHKAKIIHYFANSLSKGFSPTYDFLDKNLFLRLKETMEITPEIDLLIENAKGAFAEKSMVVSGFEKELVVSDFANICRRYPSLFRFINSVCRNSIMLRHHLKTLLGHD